MYLNPQIHGTQDTLTIHVGYIGDTFEDTSISERPSARSRESLVAPRSSDSMMRPTPRPNSSKVWLPVGARDLESMKEGQALLKTLEGGMWKWHVTNPGNSRMANFQCNGHEDCKRELRVVKVNDVYMIQGRGSHGQIPKEKKRANSTLSVQQEKWMRFSLDQGGTCRPAGIRVAMTKQKMEELEGAGADPFLHKEDMGGLIGALLST
jgi:hypothetical protein